MAPSCIYRRFSDKESRVGKAQLLSWIVCTSSEQQSYETRIPKVPCREERGVWEDILVCLLSKMACSVKGVALSDILSYCFGSLGKTLVNMCLFSLWVYIWGFKDRWEETIQPWSTNTPLVVWECPWLCSVGWVSKTYAHGIVVYALCVTSVPLRYLYTPTSSYFLIRGAGCLLHI